MSPHPYVVERQTQDKIREAHYAGYRQCLDHYWIIGSCDCGQELCEVGDRRLKHPLVIQPCHCGVTDCLEVAYNHDGSDDFSHGLHYLGHVPASTQSATRELTHVEIPAPEWPESAS
jgi:hypothetical protein